MPASEDELERGLGTSYARIEIGPAPVADHTGRWIQLALTSIVALLIVRVLLRARRHRTIHPHARSRP